MNPMDKGRGVWMDGERAEEEQEERKKKTEEER